MMRYLPTFLLLVLLCLLGCGQAPAQGTADQAGLAADRSLFLAEGRMHRGRRQGTRQRQVHGPGASLFVHQRCRSPRPCSHAHKRGVKVEIILDKSQRTEKYSEADFLVNVGIPTKIDAKHAIAHNKIMVIDGQTVITGSFNFTTAAEEHNAENLLVIRSPELAAKYTANWQAHAAHSDPYEAKDAGLLRNAPCRRRTAEAEPLPHQSRAGSWPRPRSHGFHRPDCKSAAKISEKNLVHYATRDEAIQAGKKPCAECNP